MASWGKAKLSSSALQEIRNINEALTEDRLPAIQQKLLQNVLAQEGKPLAKPYGLLMDFPRPQSVPSSIPAEENPSTSEAIDVHALATKIVDVVCNGLSSINVVIDLISKVTHGSVDDLVKDCWSLFVQDEHKKSFVVAMSATRSTALSVGSNVLLPLLFDSDTFQPSIQLYGPVLGWLEGNFSQSTVVPLLLDERSAVNQDPSSFKTLLNHLSENQKTESVVVLCQTILELEEWHLQSLSLILESPPIDYSAVQPATNLLSKHMDKYAENRLVGKIISTLISLLSASTPHHVFSEVADLAAQFKGPLRFRHKQALDKLSKQIKTT